MNRPTLTPRAVAVLAENRIREAMAEGAFDDLPGAGQPIPDIDQPYDPLWWVKGWVRREARRYLEGRTPRPPVTAGSEAR